MKKEFIIDLSTIRNCINSIDSKILSLLALRARAAKQIGKKKKYILCPEREASVIRNIKKQNKGIFSNIGLERVWTEIMSSCRELERSISIAYFGPIGSFSEKASMYHFGKSVKCIQCSSFEKILLTVESQKADVGMIPVENSTECCVNLNMLLRTTINVIGERYIFYNYCLMTQSGIMESITTIFAHPIVLYKLNSFLIRYYPKIKRVYAKSDFDAARYASENRYFAAIAFCGVSDSFKLKAVHILENTKILTRFFAIGFIESINSVFDKTSLVLSVPNKVGTLYDVMKIFEENNMDINKLKIDGNSNIEYYVYIDILCHNSDDKFLCSMYKIIKNFKIIRILGSYPANA